MRSRPVCMFPACNGDAAVANLPIENSVCISWLNVVSAPRKCVKHARHNHKTRTAWQQQPRQPRSRLPTCVSSRVLLATPHPPQSYWDWEAALAVLPSFAACPRAMADWWNSIRTIQALILRAVERYIHFALTRRLTIVVPLPVCLGTHSELNAPLIFLIKA